MEGKWNMGIETFFGAQDFNELSFRLSSEPAIATFVKLNNDIRTMLCTRSYRVIERFSGSPQYLEVGMSGRQKKMKAGSGNIVVADLIVDDVRSVNANRIIRVDYLGNALEQFGIQAVAECMKQINHFISELDDIETVKEAIRAYDLIQDGRLGVQ